MAEEGLWDVLVSKDGYDDIIVEGVEFTNGEVTILDVVMGDISNAIDDYSVWNQVQVYPNPVSDQLNISLPDDPSINTLILSISDITGKEVYNETLNPSDRRYSMTPEFGKGVYFISLYSSERALYKSKIFVSK